MKVLKKIKKINDNKLRYQYKLNFKDIIIEKL